MDVLQGCCFSTARSAGQSPYDGAATATGDNGAVTVPTHNPFQPPHHHHAPAGDDSSRAHINGPAAQLHPHTTHTTEESSSLHRPGSFLSRAHSGIDGDGGSSGAETPTGAAAGSGEVLTPSSTANVAYAAPSPPPPNQHHHHHQPRQEHQPGGTHRSRAHRHSASLAAHQQQQQQQQPLSYHPNAPLTRPKRAAHTPGRRPWTRARVLRERRDFFDTRVSGRAEVWASVRLVCELVEQGDVGEAQGVLDAAGCTCPSGDVSKGVFDERGVFYQVPEWVVGWPVEAVEEGEDEVEVGSESEKGGPGEEEDGEALIGGEREEKGKGRAVEVDVGPVVKLRVRLSDRGTDVLVSVGMKESVRAVVRKVRGMGEMQPHVKVKLVYMGRVLRENQSLEEQGWREGHTQCVSVFRWQPVFSSDAEQSLAEGNFQMSLQIARGTQATI
ncbi:hypothetical protein BDY21DRAFT_403371 [Lineolata rhizophorae]|uniref:Ubiquitin-like domain-containing protein n=1 Tax=Lineolata rhizophorae TaxID=578093 RepID=A0A6A6PAZ4_9PEZI|nr:hypothetical protein BDY21DRAFT_403371 [Lineolata rhizophorae]